MPRFSFSFHQFSLWSLVLTLGAIAQVPAPAPAPAPKPIVPQPTAAEIRAAADQAFYRASKVYEYGRNHEDYNEKRGALRTAELSFRSFLKNYPGHPERQRAYYRMATCQLLSGNIASAEANFKFIIDNYKKGQLVAASAFRLGTQRYNEENYKKAIPHYKKASEESEKEAVRQQALYLHARCLMLSGDKDSALKPLERLANDKSSSYRYTALLALAHIKFELSKFNEALTYFEKLTEVKEGIQPDIKAEANLYRGICYGRLGNKDKAEEVIEETIDTPGIKNDYKAIAQNELFQIYFEHENIDKVISQYEKGIYPGEKIITAKNYLLSGYALLKKDLYERSVTAFNQVETLVPNSALSFEASYRRLYSLYQLDRVTVPDHADDFKKIYGGYQKEKYWHKVIGLFKAESLFHAGQIEQAAKVYRSIDSNDLPQTLQANFLFKKMSCFVEAEDHSSVITTAGHFLDQFPQHDLNYEVHARRGKAYLESGNYPSALSDFQKILKEIPESSLTAVALQGMITVYRKERDYEELILASRLLLDKFPNLQRTSRGHAYFWMGWGHFKLEQFAECIEPLRKAREISPDFYNEPSGTRIFLASYYLQDADIMKQAFYRVKEDVPGKYLPPRIIAWLGIQRFQKEDYYTSASVLEGIANKEDPLETPIDVWRYLAKASIETGKYEQALTCIDHVLDREEEDFWKSDALLDKSQALIGTNQTDEAISTAQEGLNYEPKGTIEAGLRFSIAEAKYRKGELDVARDEYLLVAERFKGDETVRPYALWKAIQIMKAQSNTSSIAMSQALREEFPEWQPPVD